MSKKDKELQAKYWESLHMAADMLHFELIQEVARMRSAWEKTEPDAIPSVQFNVSLTHYTKLLRAIQATERIICIEELTQDGTT